MTTRNSVAALLLVTGFLYNASACANDAGLTVLLTTGTGAAIGQSIGGRNGAAIGAATGALIGISIANQQQYRPAPARVVYAPPQSVWQSAPIPTYQQQYEQHYRMLNPQAYQVRYQPVPVYAPVVQRPAIVYPVSVRYQHRGWHREHVQEHRGHERHERYGYGY